MVVVRIPIIKTLAHYLYICIMGIQANKERLEMKLGERYYIEELDGATLCSYCQYYFKGNGDLTTCNDCI